MAHGGQKTGLGEIGRLRSPARLVRNRLRLLELGDQDVLLGAKLEHGDGCRMKTLGEDDEVDVDARCHCGHGQIEEITYQQQPHDDGERHGNGADVEDRHHGRGERHADGEHDHQRGEHEDVRRERVAWHGALGGVHSDQREPGPREPVDGLGRDEALPP